MPAAAVAGSTTITFGSGFPLTVEKNSGKYPLQNAKAGLLLHLSGVRKQNKTTFSIPMFTFCIEKI